MKWLLSDSTSDPALPSTKSLRNSAYWSSLICIWPRPAKSRRPHRRSIHLMPQREAAFSSRDPKKAQQSSQNLELLIYSSWVPESTWQSHRSSPQLICTIPKGLSDTGDWKKNKTGPGLMLRSHWTRVKREKWDRARSVQTTIFSECLPSPSRLPHHGNVNRVEVLLTQASYETLAF